MGALSGISGLSGLSALLEASEPVGTDRVWDVGGDSNFEGVADLQSSGNFPDVGSYLAINYKDRGGTDQTDFLNGLDSELAARLIGNDPADDITITFAASDGDPTAETFFWIVGSIVSGAWTGASTTVEIRSATGMYLTDENGNYLTDENGNRLTL